MMTTRFNKGGASAPPAVFASAILSLPRDALADLVTLAIDRLDEIDGDSDFEPEQDCCLAGDDILIAGPASPGLGEWNVWTPTEDDEGEEGPTERRAQARKVRGRACYQADRWGTRWRFYAEPVAPRREQLLRRKRGMPRRPRA